MSHIKDFRNMQQTQFDPGQVIKGSFSELKSALRTVGTNAVIGDAYTHIDQVVDGNDRPTEVTYYQAIKPAIDQLTFVGDVATSLQDKWFSLITPLTKVVHVFHYIVDGNGSAPIIPNAVFHPINISENDPANVVRYASQIEINLLEDFITNNPDPLSTTLNIEYFEFSNGDALDVQSTGFTVSRIQQGDSKKVGHVVITYDVDGNPIFNGTTLFGLTYNTYKAEFERSISLAIDNLTVDVDLDAFSATPDSTLSVGSEDGTSTGTKHALKVGSDLNLRVKDEDSLAVLQTLENNLFERILKGADRDQQITYTDFGTKDQRITQISYSSPSVSAATAVKTINYVLDSGKYRRTNIIRSIV